MKPAGSQIPGDSVTLISWKLGDHSLPLATQRPLAHAGGQGSRPLSLPRLVRRPPGSGSRRSGLLLSWAVCRSASFPVGGQRGWRPGWGVCPMGPSPSWGPVCLFFSEAPLKIKLGQTACWVYLCSLEWGHWAEGWRGGTCSRVAGAHCWVSGCWSHYGRTKARMGPGTSGNRFLLGGHSRTTRKPRIPPVPMPPLHLAPPYSPRRVT